MCRPYLKEVQRKSKIKTYESGFWQKIYRKVECSKRTEKDRKKNEECDNIIITMASSLFFSVWM